ncbi:MAG TPA: hypothetical protein PLY76_04060 [Flavobacteriales bacterium]|nr:hypothetical protein [Flavobacteriales bacterium]
MKYRKLALLLVLVPGLVLAQMQDAQGPLREKQSETSPLLGRGAGGEGQKGPGVRANATTLTVLLANCPKSMSATEWLRMMEVPANRALFPLRITQGMLDTLPVKELDLRFQYVFAPNTPQRHEIRQH